MSQVTPVGPDGIPASKVFEKNGIPNKDILGKLRALRSALLTLRKNELATSRNLWQHSGLLLDLETSLVIENAGIEIIDEAIKRIEQKVKN